MTWTVLLFASLKDAAGRQSVDVSVVAPQGRCTVAELLRACSEQFPELSAWLPHVRVAVDHAYANLEDDIGPAAEVALIPPVSGGC